MNKLLFIVFGFFAVISSAVLLGTHSFFSDRGLSTTDTFTAALLFPSPSPTSTPVASNPGDVVINEINWSGNNTDSDDEWIELRNMTASPINLNGWTITNLGQDVDITITDPSAVISPNGYFLITKENKTDSRINVDTNLVISNIALRDLGEQLILKDPTSGSIDTANTTGAWFAGTHVLLSPSPTPAKSMERKDSPGDGTIGSNWQMASTHTNLDANGEFDEFGTPGGANGL